MEGPKVLIEKSLDYYDIESYFNNGWIVVGVSELNSIYKLTPFSYFKEYDFGDSVKEEFAFISLSGKGWANGSDDNLKRLLRDFVNHSGGKILMFETVIEYVKWLNREMEGYANENN